MYFLKQSNKKKSLRVILLLVLGGGIIFFFQLAFSAPAYFPAPYRLIIEPGQTLFSISDEMTTDQAIRYPRLFELSMIILGSEKRISSGEYYFETPVSAIEIALRISGRQFGISRKKVTFPEGFTNKQIAARLGQTFSGFDSVLFSTLAKGSEGYLFPDTYSFFPSVTPDFILATLKRNFDTKTSSLESAIETSGRTKKEIITMASILEKEASGDADRSVVAGILWKRYDSGMALQVDAPFLYILGKESKDLTKDDLALNSPYNTYRNKGLPPGPIGNPGLAAITAAIYPEASPYLYYLHDSKGQIHYAVTYKEHQKNIIQYLH
jgi:UPF0755 protein